MVQVRDLVMRLRSAAGVVTILDDVTLDVPPGQFVAVTGAVGQRQVHAPRARRRARPPHRGLDPGRRCGALRLDEDALARLRLAKIGYVFQSFHLIPTLTALENVVVPLELAGASGRRSARGRAPRGGRA